MRLLQHDLINLKKKLSSISVEVTSRGLTSMGYSSSIRLRWFPWRERPSSSWSGESEGSGGGGEWARARDWPGEPPGAFRSRSTRRVMVGEVPVRSATAWSCLASVMSTPLIWIDSKTNHGGCQPTRTYSVRTGHICHWHNEHSSLIRFYISSLKPTSEFLFNIYHILILINWDFASAPKWVLLFEEEPNTYTEQQQQAGKKREHG